MWNYLQFGHLFVIILPLKIEPDGDVPSLEGCEDRMDWCELTDPEELPNDLELLLFFDN